METAIIICSRSKSSRLPEKVFRLVNGVPVLVHLLTNLLKNQPYPVVLAIPKAEHKAYINILSEYPYLTNESFLGNLVVMPNDIADEDPMLRMSITASILGIKNIIRITHDKIFVDVKNIEFALEEFKTKKADYLYSSTFVSGSGFEIISNLVLKSATLAFNNVEHISYAVRLKASNIINFNSRRPKLDVNLLIDYPEDLQLMEILLSQIKEPTLDSVCEYLVHNPVMALINRPPKVTIYTCAFNAAKTLQNTMDSVSVQKGFPLEYEYILIDDHSTDRTAELMAEFTVRHQNVRWVRNSRNLGLSSSSNVALALSRGKYIVRLDADDVFANTNSVKELYTHATTNNFEATYPDNFFGDHEVLQRGDEHHHVGGALFEKRALNFLKFTDGLRNYEGLDLFKRAQDTLNLGYLRKPVFFYTQSPDSMSRTNLEERAKTRKEIEERHG